MKKFSKFSFAAIAVMAMLSASSCSVEYRARHPRPKRVIVVGMAEPTAPAQAATVAKISQQSPEAATVKAEVNTAK